MCPDDRGNVTAILLGESQVDHSSRPPSLLRYTNNIEHCNADPSLIFYCCQTILQYHFDGEGRVGDVSAGGGGGGEGEQAVHQLPDGDTLVQHHVACHRVPAQAGHCRPHGHRGGSQPGGPHTRVSEEVQRLLLPLPLPPLLPARQALQEGGGGGAQPRLRGVRAPAVGVWPGDGGGARELRLQV